MRFSADADDHTRVLGSGLSDRPGERLSRWRKPSASLVDPVCSGYGPAPSVPSRKTAPVAASAVASLSLRPARPILVPLLCACHACRSGRHRRGRGRTSGRVLRPIKSGPSQGRHRPLGTAHPHAMANARQAVRPVISRSTPAATSLAARSSPVRAETPSRRASRRPVISGSRSATAPAAAAGSGRFPEARRSGGPPPAADRVRGRRAVLPRRRSRDRSARNPLPLAARARRSATPPPCPHLSTGEQAPRSGDPGP